MPADCSTCARYLSTSTGRFTSVDPFSGYLNYPASMPPYQYAYNNPLRYVDPSGEIAFDLGGLAISAGIGSLVGIGINIDRQLRENGGDWNCIDWDRVGKAALVGAVGGALSYFVILTSATLMVIGGSTIIPLLFTIAGELIINELTYAAELKVDGRFDTYEPSADRIAGSIIFSVIGFNGAPSSLKRSIGVAALDSADDSLWKPAKEIFFSQKGLSPTENSSSEMKSLWASLRNTLKNDPEKLAEYCMRHNMTPEKALRIAGSGDIYLDDLAASMANGWDGPPLRVIEVDGNLVSLDNRRLTAAKILDMLVPIEIVDRGTVDLFKQWGRDDAMSSIPIRIGGKNNKDLWIYIDMLGQIIKGVN